MTTHNKIWKDPVWASVIATGIATLVTYLFGFWPWIAAQLSHVVNFALDSTAVPNWGLGLLGVLSLGTILIIVIVVWDWFTPDEQRAPHPRYAYTRDEFYGLHWRWSYHAGSVTVKNLGMFCPQCDVQLYIEPSDRYTLKQSLRCDACGHTAPWQRDFNEDLDRKARRLIERNIRRRIEGAAVPPSGSTSGS